MALPCLPETKYTNRQRQELQVKVLINVLVHVTEHFIHTVAGVFRAILPFLTGPLSRPNTPTSDATLPPVSMSVSAPSSSSSATPSASPASPLPPSGGVGPKQTVDLASREDKDIVHKIIKGEINHYNLERQLNDCTRAVNIRRRVFEHTLGRSLAGLPYEHYDYGKVLGQCCELVIGHIPLPVGVVGPLVLDGTSYFVPMATVEGCLVASANRGCKAIGASGGGSTIVIRDGMSRGPVVRMPSCVRAGQLKCWLDQVENVERIAEAFNGTTRFGRLECVRSCSLSVGWFDGPFSPFCPPDQVDGSGTQCLSSVHCLFGRRHGHEHGFQGGQQGSGGFAATVYRYGDCEYLGELLHGQETCCDELA
eukprot:TRINITY_DN1247_c0_g1_i1.p1 TRINITY_DN1247_c0_g1~~TRINITY_DN1247_c0_g1_i1.p1  ORF type:complete len:399 (-),score=55.45 TRINITY_DN1247_c0_g1_i1:718-1815(-)